MRKNIINLFESRTFPYKGNVFKIKEEESKEDLEEESKEESNEERAKKNSWIHWEWNKGYKYWFV